MTPPPDTDKTMRAPHPGDVSGPLFLERRSYRQRRIMDAARLLPVLGALLWCVPLLWAEGRGAGASEGVRTSSAIVYIFGVWAFLAVGALVLSLVIRDRTDRGAPDGRTGAGTVPSATDGG